MVAASMIYVAVADLIPGLHRRPELRDPAFQVLLIALGIAPSRRSARCSAQAKRTTPSGG